MSLDTKEKKKIIDKFAQNASDTGSPEVQVALLSGKIGRLSSHLKIHRKDAHSRRGLLSMVSKRRRLLNYLKEKDENRFQTLTSNL